MSKAMLRTDSAEVARLTIAYQLATAHKSKGFKQLLRRFKDAYQMIMELDGADNKHGLQEKLVALPAIETPDLPLPGMPPAPTYDEASEN